jgi:hypothetical protein
MPIDRTPAITLGERRSSMSLDAMLAPFADEELQHFAGRGGKTMTYIEDETVMDRLDSGFGMGNWCVQVEPFPYVEGVVKVRLGVRPTDTSEWVWYEDFGYPNREGGESLKEAVSDGIRRCGRYLGIARDLYRKDTAPARVAQSVERRVEAAKAVGSTPTPGTITPIRQAPVRSSTEVPEPPLDWDVLDDKKPQSFAAGQVAKIEADGSWTYPQLADRAKALSVPLKVLGDTSKRLFGQEAWKLTDLTGEQRYMVAVEVGLL